MTWARAGQYQHDSAQYRETVEILAELVFRRRKEAQPGERQESSPCPGPLFANDLIPTARWMDENWPAVAGHPP
ncbi:MAG: hypothetical protein HS126_37465 [Anaerolineales bacterium]|nr:hypothetical protein [Anaerolineales bacterium]